MSEKISTEIINENQIDDKDKDVEKLYHYGIKFPKDTEKENIHVKKITKINT